MVELWKLVLCLRKAPQEDLFIESVSSSTTIAIQHIRRYSKGKRFRCLKALTNWNWLLNEDRTLNLLVAPELLVVYDNWRILIALYRT